MVLRGGVASDFLLPWTFEAQHFNSQTLIKEKGIVGVKRFFTVVLQCATSVNEKNWASLCKEFLSVTKVGGIYSPRW